MTELLENSDNTNESAVVSESPANEATISLAAVQALADALQKIESYTPTVWVDNESPDIDAAHLNKEEQAIMRVTTAMNSAVDVIKDLQSQINTTNNNLSNTDGRVTQLYSDLSVKVNDLTDLLNPDHYDSTAERYLRIYRVGNIKILSISFKAKALTGHDIVATNIPETSLPSITCYAAIQGRDTGGWANATYAPVILSMGGSSITISTGDKASKVTYISGTVAYI